MAELGLVEKQRILPLPAEMFVNAGAHYVALDFIAIKEAGGDLRVMAEQVRRGIAWVYGNAGKFDGDRDRPACPRNTVGVHWLPRELGYSYNDRRSFGISPDNTSNVVDGRICRQERAAPRPLLHDRRGDPSGREWIGRVRPIRRCGGRNRNSKGFGPERRWYRARSVCRSSHRAS